MAARKQPVPPASAVIALVVAVVIGLLCWNLRRDEKRRAAAAASASASMIEPVPTMIPDPAPASTTVRITLDLAPKDAIVELDGQPEKPPFILQRDGKTHLLVVSAPGHVTVRREVRTDADAMLMVHLARDLAAKPSGS